MLRLLFVPLLVFVATLALGCGENRTPSVPELEQSVVAATSLKAMTFTVPWLMDGAPTDLFDKLRDGMPTLIRLADRWVLQPRYRRLVAAATGVRGS